MAAPSSRVGYCGGADLDQVVGQDPVSGPDSASFGAVRAVRSPSVSSLRLLTRPSLPVRHFTVRPSAGRCCSVCLASAGFALRGLRTFPTPISCRASSMVFSPCPRSAVTVRAYVRMGDDPLHRGRRLRRVDRVTLLQCGVEQETVVVVDDLAFDPNLTALPTRLWRSGGPSGLCRTTRRVASGGVVPATRCRVCAAIWRVAPSSSLRVVDGAAQPARPRRHTPRAADTRSAARCVRWSIRRALAYTIVCRPGQRGRMARRVRR